MTTNTDKLKGFSTTRLPAFREYQSAFMLDSEEGEHYEYYIPSSQAAAFLAAGGKLLSPKPVITGTIKTSSPTQHTQKEAPK